ncbi:MAG: LysW-gamma-L-lysine carboxypeptidase [Candidatus Paceibacteria bacterium]|jgi:LysW-gamma-L-lysine carboxypeptidase
MNVNVQLLHSMVSTPSVSGDEGAVGEVLVSHMNANGFDARVDEVGNAIGLRSGAAAPDGAARRCVVLLGHIDTVPGQFPVHIKEGLLYGRGSVDAKGSIATFTRAVAQVTPAPGVDLVVIGCVEEEVSTSKGARHVRELFAPEVCFIGEPSGWDAITIGYKGCLRFQAEFVAPVGHSAGPIAPVAELAADLWQAFKSWCAEHNQEHERLFDQVLPSLTEFVTTSDGLHDRVRLRVGFRLPPAFDIGVLRAIAKDVAPEAQVEFSGHEPAWQSKSTSPVARALRRSILQAGGRGAFKKKTGTSDMNVVGPAWDCPIVAYGPGDSSLDHTPNEHLSLVEYEQAIEVLGAALVNGGWALGS